VVIAEVRTELRAPLAVSAAEARVEVMMQSGEERKMSLGGWMVVCGKKEKRREVDGQGREERDAAGELVSFESLVC